MDTVSPIPEGGDARQLPGNETSELALHQKYFKAGLFTSFLVSALTGAILVGLGYKGLSLIAWAFFTVDIALAWTFAVRPETFPVLMYVNVFICFTVPFVLQVLLGGFFYSGGIGLWAVVVPMSVVILGMPWTWLWFAALGALEILCMALEIHLQGRTPQLPPGVARWFLVFNLLGVSLYIFLRVKHVLGIQNKLRGELRETHKYLLKESWRAERLLMNIFPSRIATRLKLKPETLSESFPDASVLFADISGFTRLSSELKPQEVVDFLNNIFSLFDMLADEFGIEKIKTIGDGYMGVGNVSRPSSGHLEEMADMALAMTRVFKEGAGSHPELGLRVGIHCGPVVAGVIGQKKFTYDLWGDTVNTANRMESLGLPGKIQVSEAVHSRLKSYYDFEPRGEIQVKGKGGMKTFWLKGKLQGDLKIPELGKPSSELNLMFE